MHVECTKRERRMSILLSDEEQLIVDRYLEKYKITNKSRWLRETILMFIPVSYTHLSSQRLTGISKAIHDIGE